MKIKVLPQEIVGKIAAGEVITRPADVVKQLVENSIDAKATRITVNVQAGGSELIRVVDDGIGISVDDLPVSLARYATSKLAAAGDLLDVVTLGFRGEALASIAAVSETTIFSRADGVLQGAVVHASGGEVDSVQPRGGPVGTTVSVRNLYFNTPARRRFLKSRGAEASRVNQLIGHFALAYPEIRFTVTSEERTVLDSPGTGRLIDAIRAVTGVKDAEQLIEVSGEDVTGLSLSGYVSMSSVHYATRQNQVILANRRLIQNRSLSYGLEDAYQPGLPTGRHPLAVLDIRMPFDQVDVNIHPAKAEVRFANERGVYSFVRRAIRTTLMRHAPWPAYGGVTRFQGSPGRGSVDANIEFGRLIGQPTSMHRRDANTEIFTANSVERAGERENAPVEPVDATTASSTGDVESSQSPAEPIRPTTLRSLGQIDNTYIVAEGPDGVYFIDQHAAHERVLYEIIEARRLAGEPQVQPLLQPIALDLSTTQQLAVRASGNTLKDQGFEIEEFGPDNWVLRGIPAGIPESRLVEAAMEAIDGLGEERSMPDGRWRISATIACHSAIRAGDDLSPSEISELLSLLEGTDVSRFCPHGRPIIIHLPTSRLARDFGRR